MWLFSENKIFEVQEFWALINLSLGSKRCFSSICFFIPDVAWRTGLFWNALGLLQGKRTWFLQELSWFSLRPLRMLWAQKVSKTDALLPPESCANLVQHKRCLFAVWKVQLMTGRFLRSEDDCLKKRCVRLVSPDLAFHQFDVQITIDFSFVGLRGHSAACNHQWVFKCLSSLAQSIILMEH